jgi:hypothetical protein
MRFSPPGLHQMKGHRNVSANTYTLPSEAWQRQGYLLIGMFLGDCGQSLSASLRLLCKPQSPHFF